MPEQTSESGSRENSQSNEEQEIKKELGDINREYEASGLTLELRTAFSFMLGRRPAGGPYELTLTDDGRSKSSQEYAVGMKLTELPSDEQGEEKYPNGRVLLDEAVHSDKLDKFMDLERRRSQTMDRLNGARRESK